MSIFLSALGAVCNCSPTTAGAVESEDEGIALATGSADSVDLTFRVSLSCLGRGCFAASRDLVTGAQGVALPLLLLLICDSCKRRSRDPCFFDNNRGLWSSFLKAKCVPTVRLPSWPCADSSFFACFFLSASAAADDWSWAPAFLSKSSCCQRYWALQMQTGLRFVGPLPEWPLLTLALPFSFC